MAEDVMRAPMIGRLLWRGRRLLVVLALLGTGLGLTAWYVLPQSFTSTTKVLLQPAGDEEEVATAAQIAMGRVVVQRAIDSLGWQPGSVDKDAVSAEATQGSVIVVTATAAKPDHAQALAARVAKEFAEFSTEVANRAADAAAEALSGRREGLERQITELDQSISSPDSASDDQQSLRSRRTDLLQALHSLEQQVADAKAEAAVGKASIQVIEPAALPENSSTPSLPVLAAGGAALATAVGAAALTTSRLGDRRLRRRTDIASALGAPVLGTVAAPPDSDDGRSRRSPLRWLIGKDAAECTAETPNEHQLELLRYNRVLERLYGVSEGPLRITVVAADDDSAALRSLARLAAAAETGGRAVTMLDERRALATTVGNGTYDAAASAIFAVRPEGASHDFQPGALLRVVVVQPARPTIARDSGASGALIVTTSGTRTNWELLAAAEACRDATLPVLGALMVVPIGAEEDVEAGSRIVASDPVSPQAGRLNGHTNGVRP